MRKLLMTVTMLLVPAIASAWTLPVKVTNNSTGIALGNKATVSFPGAPVSPNNVVTSGTKYFYPASTVASATIVIANKANVESASITAGGTTTSATAAAQAGSITITKASYPTASTIQVQVTYKSATMAKANVSLVQGTGGNFTVKYGNAVSSTGFTGLPKPATLTLTAIPAAGYAFDNYTLKGGINYTNPLAFSNTTTQTIKARFKTSIQISALNFTVPLVVTKGTAFTATTNASTMATTVFTRYSTNCSNQRQAATSGPTTTTFGITPTVDGTCNVTVKVSLQAGYSSAKATRTITVNDPTVTANQTCTSCHAGSTPTVVSTFASSSYSIKLCTGCHTAAPHNVTSCTTCHNTGTHNFTAAGPTGKGCIGCHDVAAKLDAGHPGSFVGKVAGVRAITGEFAKWSHHVTGVTLNNAHCAACHLEGKVDAGAIVIDDTKHMIDGKTHLRNADDDTDFQWDPTEPNHSTMDNFCMSCHDADGATSTASVAIQGLINAAGAYNTGRTASAGNPFGDTISNRYDKMARPRVVDVSGQFATTNASHHAVKGKKYSGRTRKAGDARIITAVDPDSVPGTKLGFALNSSATLKGKRSTIYDSRVSGANDGMTPAAAYNTSKFTEGYLTLTDPSNTTAGDRTLGDDSRLHCGDCHTVGQFRQADVGVASRNAAVIGAHGSNNEYMLRNSIGTDERHVGQTYFNDPITKINTFTNAGSPWLVCFNCHAYQAYGSIGSATGATGTNHAGEYANANRCNGPVNTITFSGYTTSNGVDEPYAFRLGLGSADSDVTNASSGDSDFSNLFGIQCINCHNSGPAEGFGGIHGSKLNSYVDANGNLQKPRRFLSGLGNTMYVPGNASGKDLTTMTADEKISDLNWEVKSIGSTMNSGKTAFIDNGGCYTIVPETGPENSTGQTVPAEAPYSVSPAWDQAIDVPTTGTKIFGTWGGCDDHRGNAHGKGFNTNGTVQGKTSAGVNTGWIDSTDGTVPTGGAGVARKVLRPVTY